VEYIHKTQPKYVSIDSPLGLPGGGREIDPAAGIVRIAERDLASIGIPAYPAMIDSMRDLTLRGITLKRRIESLSDPPVVLESYPGAAQDILCIPRKQKSLAALRSGLSELGLTGRGLSTKSHDEMDAVTAAIVGRYFEVGEYEAMGIPAEAQLIVPKIRPLEFEPVPVIGLAGRMGTGKSIVARYLAVFYGFRWIRTRDIIRALLIDDINASPSEKLFPKDLRADAITDQDLRDFGVTVLEQLHQIPLRAKLTQLIAATHAPVVVDALRDFSDLDKSKLGDRAIRIWYIDSGEQRLAQRLRERITASGVAPPADKRIDQRAIVLRDRADAVIPNNAGLEDLRWSVDDRLFEDVRVATLI